MTDTNLERVTVNLIPRASKAMRLACELTGDSKTDTINRALQIYAYIEQIITAGGEILTRGAGDKDLQLLKIM